MNSTPTQFLGRYEVSLDDKNRLTIPFRWREKDGVALVELYVGVGMNEHALVLMPERTLESIVVRIRESQALSEQDKQQLVSGLTRNFEQLTVDKAGRVGLKAEMLGKAGIKGKAVLTGDGDRIKLWSVEEYEKVSTKQEDLLRKHAAVIGL